MTTPAPPLGLCSWHLEHSDLRVPAVTMFEGTSLCEACNSRAHAESEDAGDSAFDALQEMAEQRAGAMLGWIRARAVQVPSEHASPSPAGPGDPAQD